MAHRIDIESTSNFEKTSCACPVNALLPPVVTRHPSYVRYRTSSSLKNAAFLLAELVRSRVASNNHVEYGVRSRPSVLNVLVPCMRLRPRLPSASRASWHMFASPPICTLRHNLCVQRIRHSPSRRLSLLFSCFISGRTDTLDTSIPWDLCPRP